MQYSIIFVSALAGLAAAYTPPTTQDGGENPIATPGLDESVQEGKPFAITWQQTTPGKVSLLLVKGPSNNVVYYSTIADSIDNSGSYTWTPDTDIPVSDDGKTGYGIQLVEEGSGKFQYSTQFGLVADPDAPVSSSSSSSASSSATDSSSSSSSLSSSSSSSPSSSSSASSNTSVAATTTSSSVVAVITSATGTNNVTSPVLTPTSPMTVPNSLTTVVATGSGGVILSTSVAVVGGPGSSPSASGAKASTTAVSTAGAASGAGLSGAAAAFAGFLAYLVL